MKMVSKLALAATLIGGANMAVLAVPALAAKKDQAQAGPALSPAVRASIVTAQTALSATPKDLAAAEPAIAAAEAAAKTDTERYYVTSLRLSLENAKSQSKTDVERLAVLGPLLDTLIANPATPKNELAIRLNERGSVAFGAKKYADALTFLNRARDAGYTDQDLLLKIAQAKVESGDLAGGMTDLDAAVKAEKAAGRKVPEAWYKYAISRLMKTNSPAVDEWTREWLSDYGTKENWRAAVYAFGLSGPNVAKYSRNRLDLYRLLYATKSLAGQKEYIDYADVALNVVGLPEEAKTAIAEGLSSGAIPAGNASAVALQKQATAKLAGNPAPAAKEKLARAGTDPDLARQAGDSYFATRNFAKAAEMYQLAETKGYADKDRNNLHLGMALALAGDRAGAQVALGKVSADPYRAIARLWTTYATTPPVA